MERGGYLKLNCIQKKYGKQNIPVTFLVDAGKSHYPTWIVLRDENRVLCHKPKPLRKVAYHFSKIEDESGRLIIDKITKTGKDAEEFVQKIIEHAVPISEEEYMDTISSVSIPMGDSKGRSVPESKPPLETSRADSPPRTVRMSAGLSPTGTENMVVAASPVQAEGPVQEETQEFSGDKQKVKGIIGTISTRSRKKILHEIIEAIEDLNTEDLEALLRLANSLRKID